MEWDIAVNYQLAVSGIKDDSRSFTNKLLIMLDAFGIDEVQRGAGIDQPRYNIDFRALGS